MNMLRYFDDIKVDSNRLIQCPECDCFSVAGLWKETEVGCEDCGSHAALKCPNCEQHIDLVYAGDFKTATIDYEG